MVPNSANPGKNRGFQFEKCDSFFCFRYTEHVSREGLNIMQIDILFLLTYQVYRIFLANDICRVYKN